MGYGFGDATADAYLALMRRAQEGDEAAREALWVGPRAVLGLDPWLKYGAAAGGLVLGLVLAKALAKKR